MYNEKWIGKLMLAGWMGRWRVLGEEGGGLWAFLIYEFLVENYLKLNPQLKII